MGEPEDLIYFDNNGTTFATPSVVFEMAKHHIQGNPSADYTLAKIGQSVIADTCSTLKQITKAPPDRYEVVMTSGASESNNQMIYGVVAGYRRWIEMNKIKNPRKPIIIMSSIEHKT